MLLAILPTRLPDFAFISICDARTFTMANSAATKKPFKSTKNKAKNKRQPTDPVSGSYKATRTTFGVGSIVLNAEFKNKQTVGKSIKLIL